MGARVVRKWYEPGSTVATGSAWVRLNAWHEFSGDTSVSYQTAAGPLAFDSHMRGTWGELEVGFSHAISSSTSIFASLDYQHSVNGAGREGGSFSAGVADGGLPAVGLGLSTQLSPNARLSTKASYGTGGKGQPNVAATMVELALKW